MQWYFAKSCDILWRRWPLSLSLFTFPWRDCSISWGVTFTETFNVHAIPRKGVMHSIVRAQCTALIEIIRTFWCMQSSSEKKMVFLGENEWTWGITVRNVFLFFSLWNGVQNMTIELCFNKHSCLVVAKVCKPLCVSFGVCSTLLKRSQPCDVKSPIFAYENEWNITPNYIEFFDACRALFEKTCRMVFLKVFRMCYAILRNFPLKINDTFDWRERSATLQKWCLPFKWTAYSSPNKSETNNYFETIFKHSTNFKIF